MKDIKTLFFERVKKTDGCWEWIGTKGGAGYGTFYIKGEKRGKRFYAHRLAWMIYFNEVPTKDLWVLHTCDNPPCVRPDHLWLGTSSDNSQDREDKGRGNRTYNHVMGELNWNAKLTSEQVLEIRESYKSRIMTMKMLAEKFNVYQGTICCIISRKSWKHL